MRWREIVDSSNQLDNQTLFGILGVVRDAEPAQVKSAYYDLAKRWHPDRLPPELAPVKDRAEGVFRYMSRAHDTLVDEERRLEYLKSLDEGGGTPAAERELKRKFDIMCPLPSNSPAVPKWFAVTTMVIWGPVLFSTMKGNSPTFMRTLVLGSSLISMSWQ